MAKKKKGRVKALPYPTKDKMLKAPEKAKIYGGTAPLAA